ncbi:MAG: hypothetical protein J6Q85_02495 [Clostridia bacterium]|nr:hypothetical protein [Clostridia bacterium]
MDNIKLSYYEFLDGLSDEDRELLRVFFREFDLNFSLSKAEKRAFRQDFEEAITVLCERGASVREACERLSLTNLGGFYARPSIAWFPLDDAAKIYPICLEHGLQNNFRISVYFKEEVVPEILQMALTFTIKRFPGFSTSLKKGFFWHYLDAVKKRFPVEEERDAPCQPIKVSISGSSSFRIMYYRNRMSAEFFHILTDGTGASVFVKALAGEYLRLLGINSADEDGDLIDIHETPTKEELENAFVKVEKAATGSGFVDKSSLQMSGKLSSARPCRVLHFKMNKDKLHEAAKRHGVTVTVYLLAKMFLATSAACDELTGDINIQLPVNMRKFYQTKTLRNFAMFTGIKIPIDKISDTDELFSEIVRQMEEKTSKEKMHEMITAAVNIVSSIRYIPLVIKAPVAKLVYGFIGENIYTTTLSNLGIVKMPKEYSEHIESMDFCLGAPLLNRLACAVVTFGDITTFSVTKMTPDPTFEEKMYKYLSDDGIEIKVEGSEYYAH